MVRKRSPVQTRSRAPLQKDSLNSDGGCRIDLAVSWMCMYRGICMPIVLMSLFRPVAPTVEQQTPNLRVGGSSPSWPATN
jgi:hypothetical protein